MSTSNTLTKTDLANILNEIVAIDGTDMTSQEIEDFVDSLNVTGINAVDYIVEEGTDNGWNYKKYNNGTYDAWQTVGSNVAVSTANGSLYYSAQQTITLPSFTKMGSENYAINASINGVESIWFEGFSGTSLDVTYRIIKATSRASASRAVTFTLMGKWK